MTPTAVTPERWQPPLRRAADAGPGYYDQPVLLSGPWHWLITVYFHLGGVSGVSFLLAALARGVGGERGRAAARAGSIVSLVALVPAPALLILDLGRRGRFQNMLRVFKPLSPMNTGAWALTLHGVAAGLGAWHELAVAGALPGPVGAAGRRIPVRLVDIAAAPVALYFSGYTGTLLATTAIPLWARTPFLGPLFMASAAATGAAAVDGAMALSGRDGRSLEAARLGALFAEAAAELVYERALGEAVAKPLTSGRAARWLRAHRVFGIGVPLALAVLPGRRSRWSRLASSAAAVGGGFLLRAAIIEGGHESATDPTIVLSS